MTNLEDYYLKRSEPIQGCLFALKHIIMGVNKEIIHTRIFQIPFFVYKNWRLAFLQVYGKKILFSIVVDHRLYSEQKGYRRRDGMGTTLLLDPNKDIPIEIILQSIHEQIELYDNIDQKNNNI